VQINNDNVQKHNQLMILMRSDFCHSVENQNKILRPRTFSLLYQHLRESFLETKMFYSQYPLFCHILYIVILYTKYLSDITNSYSLHQVLV
jgi:hypothetical protein